MRTIKKKPIVFLLLTFICVQLCVFPYFVCGNINTMVSNQFNPLRWKYQVGYNTEEAEISSNGEIIAGSFSWPPTYTRSLLFKNSSNHPELNYFISGMDISMALSANGEYMVLGCSDNYVYLFDTNSYSLNWAYNTLSWVLDVDICSNGDYLVACDINNRIYLF